MKQGDTTNQLLHTLYDSNDEIPAEMTVWRAVILQQLLDAASNSKLRYKKQEKQDATKWLTEYSRDFRDVCSLAGLDARTVHKQIKRALRNKCAWRKYNRNSFKGGKK